jgi:hypothetical protein
MELAHTNRDVDPQHFGHGHGWVSLGSVRPGASRTPFLRSPPLVVTKSLSSAPPLVLFPYILFPTANPPDHCIYSPHARYSARLLHYASGAHTLVIPTHTDRYPIRLASSPDPFTSVCSAGPLEGTSDTSHSHIDPAIGVVAGF